MAMFREQNDDFLDSLAVCMAILQIITVVNTSKDNSNHDVINEMHKQQNEYLEKIIEQNNKILGILESNPLNMSDK